MAARHSSAHAPRLVVRQSSALLSSKKETAHRDAKSLGLQLAASPARRNATNERTGNPSTSQSQLVRVPFAMVRNVVSSAYTWVGLGAADTTPAPLATSQCYGRTVGWMQGSFSTILTAEMTPHRVLGCCPMAARCTRYLERASCGSMSCPRAHFPATFREGGGRWVGGGSGGHPKGGGSRTPTYIWLKMTALSRSSF